MVVPRGRGARERHPSGSAQRREENTSFSVSENGGAEFVNDYDINDVANRPTLMSEAVARGREVH